MGLQDVLRALGGVQKCGDYWKAKCPAHEDRQASLSITEDKTGKVLVNCHAGCRFEDVARAAGLDAKAFFPEKERPAFGDRRGGGRIAATYDYTDEQGNLLYQAVRMEPKDFRQRRPDGNGGWVWNLTGVRKVLFRLPALLAADAGAPVFVVEGEKDVLSLSAAGLVATCNAMGAGKWDRGYTESLAGRHVVIVPDDDEPGAKHAEKVAAAEKGTAATVRVARLPNPGKIKGWDVSDWLESGGTADELMNLARRAPEWKPDGGEGKKRGDRRAETSSRNGEKGGRPKAAYADMAHEFIARKHYQADTIILKSWRGGWYRYNGICYREWTQGDVEAQVMAFLQEHHREHANKNSLGNIITNLRSTSMCAIPSTVNAPCWLDGNYTAAAGWMAMTNAIVNVEGLADMYAGKAVADGQIRRDPTPALFSTFGMDYELLDSPVDTPMWEDYLAGVQPLREDQELIQMLFGLLLVPRCYNTAFFLYGEAGTGKSVCLHVLTKMLGESNVCCVPLAQFADRFSTYPLTVNLANIVGDMPTESGRGELAVLEGVFKDVCDGASVPIERKFQDATKGPAIARCIFATNSLPHFTDRTMAIWDRLRIVGFNRRFRGTGKENLNLRFEIVEQELPAIFLWAVQGLAKLKERHPNRFPEHSNGEAEKQKLRAMCDHERTFLLENYKKSSQPNVYTEAGTVYEHYREWVSENGYKARGHANFAVAVTRVFEIEPKRGRIQGKRMTIYPGLAKQEDSSLENLDF